MIKGSITGVIIFLVLLIIFASYATYESKLEAENTEYFLELQRLRQQEWELNKNILQEETLMQSRFWNASQTLNKTNLIQEYNITQWDKPIIITVKIDYYYNNSFTAEYHGNHTITINYPIELIDKTEGITTENITQCACPKLNQSECNKINNTNFTWELHACTGLPVKNSISVYNNNITRTYQRYLLNSECIIQC